MNLWLHTGKKTWNDDKNVIRLFLSADSPFTLINQATASCLVKKTTRCLEVRWTTDNRLLVTTTRKCLGVQGKSVGSEVSQYDCDEKNDLQKWECKNETLLALKDQLLYIEFKAEMVVLSKTVGPNNRITISGTSSGACSRTHRGTEKMFWLVSLFSPKKQMWSWKTQATLKWLKSDTVWQLSHIK